MKIGFDLTLNKNIHEGMTRYSIEIVKRLISDYSNNQYTGYAVTSIFSKRKWKLFYNNIYPQLDMRIANTYLPGRYTYLAYHNPFSFISKNSIFKNDNDVMVYFDNTVRKCRTKAKRVLVLHDIIHLYDTNVSIKRYVKYLKNYKKSVKNADLIITVSEYSKREILKYFPDVKDKILITYNGVDVVPYKLSISEEKYAEIKRKYGLDKKYIIFIGQPRKNKNLTNLINAYNLLPEQIKQEYDLVLSNSNAELNSLINDLKLNSNVKLLNGFDEEDKVALLKMSSALCLVSTMEGFGIPIIEAMAAGTPVVTSNVSCLPEVAGDAARFVDPYDINNIAEGIQDVLTNDNLRTELIEKGYKRADCFSWDNAAKSFADGLNLLHNDIE